MATTDAFDFAVIGAGVVGNAIARDLAGTNSTVALIDARDDVVEGTSKANTAILHTGYDASPGTLEARLVARGYHLTKEYAAACEIAVETTGAILVAWDEEQRASLPGLKEKAEKNGYTKCEIIEPEAVYAELPDLGPGATGGLTVPDESIIDAWSVPLAFATDAVRRGAALLLSRRVLGAEVGPEYTTLATEAGDVKARWVINAAGLGGDDIDAMFGYTRLSVYPRKGELIVFDKLTRSMVPKIVLAAPSKMGKGVLISPTAFGNVMLGPTADEGDDKADTSTTEAGFEFLFSKGERIMPSLMGCEVTASYAGLRAAHNQKDYLIEVDEAQRYVIAGAIRSTGLTSAMAVSEYILGLLAQAGIDVAMRSDLPPTPVMPHIGEAQVRPYQDNARIQSDPAYGEVICFCERVTRGEIRDALESTIPPSGASGLRRRTRAMNGRCQGFFCGAHVTQILKEAKGL